MEFSMRLTGMFFRHLRVLRYFLMFCLLLAALLIALVFYADRQVTAASNKRLFNDAQAIPARKVALVLGARPGNRYFTRRIEAAAALWHSGKASWLLVSGDNRHADYNEPAAMRQALINKGVPSAAIFCDYAGFTTLDSVVRARDVFGEEKITIVSQAFHNQRAIYLAQHYGIDAIGLNAEDLDFRHGKYTQFRERFARVRALMDAKLLHRSPHFSGDNIRIGADGKNSCPGDNGGE